MDPIMALGWKGVTGLRVSWQTRANTGVTQSKGPQKEGLQDPAWSGGRADVWIPWEVPTASKGKAEMGREEKQKGPLTGSAFQSE